MKRNSQRHRPMFAQLAIGAILGILLLHPLTTLIFYMEFNDLLAVPAANAWSFLVNRLQNSALQELVPMSAVFALLGAVLGLVIFLYNRVIEAGQRRVHWLERELNVHLPSLIEKGESERLEFKSTLRWNIREKRSDKALEKVIVKSLAGLMNHRGGSLIIGVSDAGEAVGINFDYHTLKHKNADGFERALMDLVRSTLGANVCALIHCRFPLLDEKRVCWLVVEQAETPVFIQDGKVARYMVRTGNSTRELDAREVYAHVAQRESHTA